MVAVAAQNALPRVTLKACLTLPNRPDLLVEPSNRLYKYRHQNRRTGTELILGTCSRQRISSERIVHFYWKLYLDLTVISFIYSSTKVYRVLVLKIRKRGILRDESKVIMRFRNDPKCNGLRETGR